jgi:DNA-binding transcriptional regulator GbsR (MarR family)/energy-coupling factor transporter ATP-binding protein EcfA2
MQTNQLLVYNSHLKSNDEILAEFVVRQEVFQELFEAIQTATMDTPEQHYLIVGQRGMGKTTLVHRLKVGIEQDENLHKWLIPIVLQEEQYQITELANLWEVVADYLEGIDGEAFAGLFDKMEANYQRSDYERFCFELLSDKLRQANRKIVLFLENFAEFLNKLSTVETHRLREILMNNNQIRLVGTSTVFNDTQKTRSYGKTGQEVEGNFRYDKPFWEFFAMVRLEGLHKDEAQFLLRNLAEQHQKTDLLERILRESPSRVEVLRRLSGGVIRTMVLLFEIFLDNENGSALSDLNLVLDRITPLYKHRTDDLSTQQQKIIDAIARHWDSISTKEIAERTRLESKLVSAQLKQLYDNRLIEKIPTSTKNHLYQLSERFYNIWYLMRYGKRKDASRVIWLVRFLENWCSEDELEGRVEKHIEAIESGKIVGEDAIFMSEVYLAMSKLPQLNKIRLLTVVEDILPKYNFREIYDTHISQKYKFTEPLFFESFVLMKENKIEKSISVFHKFMNSGEIITNGILLFLHFDESNYLELLIGEKQYNAAYQLFNDYPEQLKERFKPTYYALMHLMKDQYPDEYLRMPAEMKETVEEILEKVK